MRFYQFGSSGEENNFFENMFGANGPNGENEPPNPPSRPVRPKTTKKGIAVRVIIYLIILALGYYVMLPPLNLQSQEFWSFAALFIIIAIAMLSTVSHGQTDNVFGTDGKPIRRKGKLSLGKILVGILAVGAIFFFGCTILASPIFQAKNYASIISGSLTTKDISEYTPTIDNVPLLDKDSAERLTKRALGNLVNEVSQFELWDGGSRQITVDGSPKRVQPLNYSGIIKWFINRKSGIPAYITVDMKSQDTKIVRLKQGMKYSPSAYFNDRLIRHLRFSYPTAMFDEPKFELDENGKPFWVAPVLKHKILLLAGTDVKGVVTCDPVTGETKYYSMGEIPDWIDNVYSADLIIQQYNWYGRYHNGFWNSIIGQKGVVRTTEGYNYIPKNNDLYCYTGVTSVVSDESNIGFIFSDMRTRDTEYYEIAGAEEYSAMESAQGLVQNLKYMSTFPLLLNIDGQPTYTVALKDDAGLVKMYGMVNMSQYQDVSTGKTIKECLSNYRDLMVEDGLIKPTKETKPDSVEISGTITDLRSAVRNGTTYYYIRLDDSDIYYSLSAADDEKSVLLSKGDKITLEAENSTDKIRLAKLK